MTDDLRRSPRVALDASVDITYGETSFQGEAHDISLGGMFVRTPRVVPFGATVSLRFRVPTTTEQLVITGVVRWTRTDGMGVQFSPFGVRETFAITEWVRRHGR